MKNFIQSTLRGTLALIFLLSSSLSFAATDPCKTKVKAVTSQEKLIAKAQKNFDSVTSQIARLTTTHETKLANFNSVITTVNETYKIDSAECTGITTTEATTTNSTDSSNVTTKSFRFKFLSNKPSFLDSLKNSAKKAAEAAKKAAKKAAEAAAKKAAERAAKAAVNKAAKAVTNKVTGSGTRTTTTTTTNPVDTSVEDALVAKEKLIAKCNSLADRLENKIQSYENKIEAEKTKFEKALSKLDVKAKRFEEVLNNAKLALPAIKADADACTATAA